MAGGNERILVSPKYGTQNAGAVSMITNRVSLYSDWWYQSQSRWSIARTAFWLKIMWMREAFGSWWKWSRIAAPLRRRRIARSDKELLRSLRERSARNRLGEL